MVRSGTTPYPSENEAKKPEESRAPWYKENPFWGGIGGFLAFFLTGLAICLSGSYKVGEVLLWLAWPFGAFALWCMINGLTTNKRNRILGTATGALLVGIIIWQTQITLPLVNPSSLPRSPGFSVDLEFGLVNIRGSGFDSGFWLRSTLGRGCILSPSDAVLLIRITNTGSYPELITSYNLTLGNLPPKEGYPTLTSELIRLPLGFGHAIFMPRKGDPVNEGAGTFRLQQGPGSFAMNSYPTQDAEPAHAIPLDFGPSLDEEIGGKYLDPDKSARGWVMFENRSGEPFFYTEMNITITDQGDHRFFYKLPLKNGNPNGDILPRTITMHPAIDLSMCKIQSYYTKAAP